MKNRDKVTFLLIGMLLLFFTQSIAQTKGSFTDSRDGKLYETIQIENKTWMAENLAYKASDNCWTYNNNASNARKYGYLYNWETANNVCPDGWRLPTKDEFGDLVLRYGGDKYDKTRIYSGPAAHDALKKGGKSGLNLLKAGRRDQGGDFREIGKGSFFWSSTEYELKHSAYYLGINECVQKDKSEFFYKISPCVLVSYAVKQKGGYVRCIKE
jgi:uncharacterized protein (TIGR02145 family)